MEELNEVRALSGGELEKYSRALFDDRNALNRVIVALAKTGTISDCEKIAEILSYAPIEAGDKNVFHAADKREPKGKRFIDMFVSACNSQMYPESKFLSVLYAVRYAKPGGELAGWRDGANEYLTARAKSNFEFVADSMDKYDKKFASYDILLRVHRRRAIDRLMDRLLNEKYFDKSSARGALVGCTELVGTLIDLFDVSDAKTRVKLSRILLLFKNDHTAGEFIKDKRENDPSKTVRAVLEGASLRGKISDPIKFLEELMMTGESVTHAEWKDIEQSEKGKEFCVAADKLFFYGEFEGRKKILFYSYGHFYDSEDFKVRMKPNTKIFVLHPVDVKYKNDGLLLLDIEQPFLQLKRPVYFPHARDKFHSTRLCGTMIDRAKFDINFKNSGFVFAADGESGKKTAVVTVGDYALAVECGMPKTCDTVDCGVLTYYSAHDIVKNNKSLLLDTARPISAATIPAVIFSELTYAAYKLFDAV